MADSILDKSVRLKEKIDRMKRERDKAKGAFGQLMQQIKTEFGCKNLDAVEKEISKTRKGLKKTKEKITTEHDRLEKELAEHEED